MPFIGAYNKRAAPGTLPIALGDVVGLAIDGVEADMANKSGSYVHPSKDSKVIITLAPPSSAAEAPTPVAEPEPAVPAPLSEKENAGNMPAQSPPAKVEAAATAPADEAEAPATRSEVVKAEQPHAWLGALTAIATCAFPMCIPSTTQSIAAA